MNAYRKVTAVFVLAFSLLSCIPGHETKRAAGNDPPRDSDGDGLSDRWENELSVRYAPQVRFHSLEKYYPANIEWFLKRCRLLSYSDTATIPQSDAEMYQKKLNNILPGLNSDSSWSLGRVPDVMTDEFYLDLDDSETARAGAAKRDWKCYIHVRPARNAMTDSLENPPGDSAIIRNIAIEYWFFYAYNDIPLIPDLFAHEGDWEHVTIVVDENGDFKFAQYRQHDYYSRRLLKSDLLWIKGTHPVVFAALGGHACYESQGNFLIRTPLDTDWLADMTNDGDKKNWWNTWSEPEYLVNLGEKTAPMNSQWFILFPGRWGNRGNSEFNSGPKGPAFNPAW